MRVSHILCIALLVAATLAAPKKTLKKHKAVALTLVPGQFTSFLAEEHPEGTLKAVLAQLAADNAESFNAGRTAHANSLSFNGDNRDRIEGKGYTTEDPKRIGELVEKSLKDTPFENEISALQTTFKECVDEEQVGFLKQIEVADEIQTLEGQPSKYLASAKYIFAQCKAGDFHFGWYTSGLDAQRKAGGEFTKAETDFIRQWLHIQFLRSLSGVCQLKRL